MTEKRSFPERSTGAALVAALAVVLPAFAQGAGVLEDTDSKQPEAAAEQAEPGARPAASPAPPVSPLAGISFSFKLDPRLAGGTYGGERWVSPPTYAGAAAQDTIEVIAAGVDPKGRPVSVSPKWVPSDPEMVTVSPGEGGRVTIVVKSAGESRLKVSSNGVSRELAIKGTVRNGVMLVEITQLDLKKPAAAPSPQAAPPPASPPASQVPEKKKPDGAAFLASNKTREGGVTLESGLQYKILKKGDGMKPTLDSTVVCQIRRLLPDGTPVENSSKGKKPRTFRVSNTIQGWREALQLMPAGSRWQLFIPPNLGFGKKGSPRSGIGPNATLIFEVELLAIKEPVTAGNEPPTASAAPRAGEN